MADEERTPTTPIRIATEADGDLLHALRIAAAARSPLLILGTRYEAVDPDAPEMSAEHRYDIRRQNLEPVGDHAEVGPVGQRGLLELLHLLYRYSEGDPMAGAEHMVNVLERIPAKELEGMQAVATALVAYVSQARRFKRLGV